MLYRWVNNQWVKDVVGPEEVGVFPGLSLNTITIGASVSDEPWPDTTFIVGKTGYYYPTIVYGWESSATSWQIYRESAANFIQYTNGWPGGCRSSTCFAWEDAHGRF